MMDYRSKLIELADEDLAAFNRRLIPQCGDVLGIRIPVLRGLAKEIAKGDWRGFLKDADEDHLEHILLQGLVINYADADIGERIQHLDEFIPKINNWAVCDTCQYKAKRTEREEYWKFVCRCTEHPEEFRKRYGVIAMLSNFADSEHIEDVLERMNMTEHEGYYLKMGVAWTVSVCFIRFPDITMRFLNDCGLDDLTYNMSIQKILDSRRVSSETKTIIRSMKRRSR